MQVDYQIKEKGKTQKIVTATIPEDAIEKAQKFTIEKLRKEAKIKGFRPGKAPDDMIKKHYGEEFIRLRSLDHALQLTYSFIVQKEKIRACATPQVKIDEKDPNKFTATIPVLPEFTIKGYDSIKIKKEEVKVTKEELDTVKSDLLKYGQTYKDVDRPAKIGDRAELEFEGFEKDTPVPGTKSSNHPVILGEGSLIPGFEEEVVGMKVGEEKDFDITFPKDYHAESFKGKKLKFHVKLQRLEEGTDPELNQELIKRLTGKDQTPEEFMKEAEKNLLARKQQQARNKREDEYIKQLVAKLKLDLPEALVNEEAQFILEDVKKNMQAKNQDFAAQLAKEGKTEQDLLKEYKKEADRRIKIRLALQYVMKEEKIEVKPADIKAEYEKIKAMYPEKDHAKLQKDFEKGYLQNQIANRLALQQLFAKVLGE